MKTMGGPLFDHEESMRHIVHPRAWVGVTVDGDGVYRYNKLETHVFQEVHMGDLMVPVRRVAQESYVC